MQVYTENIENVIIDNFNNANKSIKIVVAWFTNPNIIEKLIQIKSSNSKIDIQILVDNNSINQQHFFGKYGAKLIQSNIKLNELQNSKFNHNKFAIIDEKRIITGSYNYTIKANRNLENIIVIENKKITNFYNRVFFFLTKENYLDENIEILFKNLDFANNLISTYYNFNPKLFSKIKDKINIGECYTYFNGLYDEIAYEPGLIFNKKYIYHKDLKKINQNNSRFTQNLEQEFVLPITTKTILDYKIDTFRDYHHSNLRESLTHPKQEIDYEEFADDIEKTESSIKKYYSHKFEKTLKKSELNKISNSIDIVFENYIWTNNFAPFLNDKIILNIYDKIEAKNINNRGLNLWNCIDQLP